MRLRHDLVLVTWDDAGELALGWVQDNEINPKEMLVYSIGFLIKKTPNHIVLANTVEAAANTNQFQIPRKMIKSIEIIAKKGVFLTEHRGVQNTDATTDNRRDNGKMPGSDKTETGREST